MNQKIQCLLKSIENLKKAISKHGRLKGYVDSLESCYKELQELREKGWNA